MKTPEQIADFIIDDHGIVLDRTPEQLRELLIEAAREASKTAATATSSSDRIEAARKALDAYDRFFTARLLDPGEVVSLATALRALIEPPVTDEEGAHVAVIEWGDGEEVSTHLTTTIEGARRAVAQELVDTWGVAPALFHDDAPEFLDQNPLEPGQADDAEIETWLEGLREATTSPWVTIRHHSLPA